MYGRKNPPRRDIDLGTRTLGSVMDRQLNEHKAPTDSADSNKPEEPKYEEDIPSFKEPESSVAVYDTSEEADGDYCPAHNSSDARMKAILMIIFCVGCLGLSGTILYTHIQKNNQQVESPWVNASASENDEVSSSTADSVVDSSTDSKYTIKLKDPPFALDESEESMVKDTVAVISNLNGLASHTISKDFSSSEFKTAYEKYTKSVEELKKTWNSDELSKLNKGAQEYFKFIDEYLGYYTDAYSILSALGDKFDADKYDKALTDMKSAQTKYADDIKRYQEMLVYYGIYD